MYSLPHHPFLSLPIVNITNKAHRHPSQHSFLPPVFFLLLLTECSFAQPTFSLSSTALLKISLFSLLNTFFVSNYDMRPHNTQSHQSSFAFSTTITPYPSPTSFSVKHYHLFSAAIFSILPFPSTFGYNNLLPHQQHLTPTPPNDTNNPQSLNYSASNLTLVHSMIVRTFHLQRLSCPPSRVTKMLQENPTITIPTHTKSSTIATEILFLPTPLSHAPPVIRHKKQYDKPFHFLPNQLPSCPQFPLPTRFHIQ